MKTPDSSPTEHTNREGRFFNSHTLPSITLAGSLALALAGITVFSSGEKSLDSKTTTEQALEQELNQNALAAIQSGPDDDSFVYGSFKIDSGDSPYQTILEAKNTLHPAVDTARLAGYIAIEASARELIRLRDEGVGIDRIILFTADIDSDGNDEILAKPADSTNRINILKLG